MQNSISIEPVYDVLIVGAGPVGLATALALYQQGIENIMAIDRTREFRRVGQTVDLLPNGLKAIKYIDSRAYEQLKEIGLKFVGTSSQKEGVKKAWHHKNLQGKIIRSIPLDFSTWLQRYGEGRISIPWYDLQTTLRNLLPPEILKANHGCTNLTQDNNLVEITCISNPTLASNPFAHWEVELTAPLTHTLPPKVNLDSEKQPSRQKQLRAKLVVAADGINSTIRQILYNNSDLSPWGKPQYSGFAAIGCLSIDNVPDEIVRELEAKYFQGDRAVTLETDAQKLEQPRIILIHRQRNSLGYLLHSPLDSDFLEDKSSAEIIALAEGILRQAGFADIIIKLVSLSTPENLIYRPYYIHPVDIFLHRQPIWSQGRVVLVGDAAHGMPPFAAQGANQGLEDAALIATLVGKIIRNNDLDNIEAIGKEFRKYEEIRRPLIAKVQEATLKNPAWSQEEWDNYSDGVYSRNLEQLYDSLLSQRS